MTWQGTRYNMDELLRRINEALAARYEVVSSSDNSIYINKRGAEFHVCKLGIKDPWNCFVISYADTGEDGDCFYPEDYDNFASMLDAMIAEIDA